ncbi:MAG: serine/threonine protein kinase [Bradymonadaceae bacterium]|nr:serine/threonine protein kinase [Lujinxingiaceae bacterium]
MAEIYLARAMGYGGFERQFVLKILHPKLAEDVSFKRMLLEEAKLTASLTHVNIVPVYDVGCHDDVLYVVLDYVEGKDLHASLAQVVKRDMDFPLAVACFIAREACAGLHYAHTRCDANGQPLQLVHRDVSLHNILVSFEGDVRLIDFGVAKIDSAVREKTRAGVIKGKFGYMSPEQAWDKKLDGRSDVFSIGICLYEMLTGRSVYGQSEDMMAMIRKVRQADIAVPSSFRDDIPTRLDNIIMKALASDPAQRFTTARDLQMALSAFLAQVEPAFTPLDAGAFLREIFEEDDGRHMTRIIREGTMPDLELAPDGEPVERTEPFREVDPAAKAAILAGSFVHAEDFANEHTEVFRDERLANFRAAVESAERLVSVDDTRPRGASRRTVKIKEEKVQAAEQRVQQAISASQPIAPLRVEASAPRQQAWSERVDDLALELDERDSGFSSQPVKPISFPDLPTHPAANPTYGQVLKWAMARKNPVLLVAGVVLLLLFLLARRVC